MQANSILFLGNSITLHPPEADLTPVWTGNWGMAASSQANDYVHLLAGAIDTQTGGNLSIVPTNPDGTGLSSANVVNICSIFRAGICHLQQLPAPVPDQCEAGHRCLAVWREHEHGNL